MKSEQNLNTTEIITESNQEEFWTDIQEYWESDELTIAEHSTIKDKFLSDDDVASWINFIAMKATKTVVSKDEWSWEVPDYKTRLKALELIMRWKWHLDIKTTKRELPRWIYILSK